MKWIRTECGRIINKSDTIMMSALHGKNRYFKDTKMRVDIKKQGDTLIDVLEERDDCILVMNGVKKTIDSFNQSTKGRINFTDGTSTNIERVLKVITHEQYMPLAQPIK